VFTVTSCDPPRRGTWSPGVRRAAIDHCRSGTLAMEAVLGTESPDTSTQDAALPLSKGTCRREAQTHTTRRVQVRPPPLSPPNRWGRKSLGLAAASSALMSRQFASPLYQSRVAFSFLHCISRPSGHGIHDHQEIRDVFSWSPVRSTLLFKHRSQDCRRQVDLLDERGPLGKITVGTVRSTVLYLL